MADNIGVVITGDRKVALRFDKFPERLRGALLQRITALTDTLAARIRSAAPSKTGKLRGEVASRVYNDPDQVSGRVFVTGDYAKAGALEYGAHGTAKVAAHAARLDHVFGQRLQTPTTVMVAAHSRQLNVAARRFLRNPLQEMEGQIESGLLQAINAAVEADTE